MDETRTREVIREEIRLAIKTLNDQAAFHDPGHEVGLEEASSDFLRYAYAGACEEADDQRAVTAPEANPFEEPEPADPAVQTVVRAEVIAVLKEMRDAFYMSGMSGDYLIAERLDRIITAREVSNG